MNGKGDDSRPFSVPKEVYDDNYERTFGKRKDLEPPQEYLDVLNSGMFWELFPDLTGNWRLDRYDWPKIKGEQNASK